MKATILHDVVKPYFREQKNYYFDAMLSSTMIRPMNGVAGYR